MKEVADEEKLCIFLTELDREYKSKAIGSLYELNVNLIQSQYEIIPSWYDSHIRKESKGLFQKFPVVKNTYNQAICPICEGVFSTKVTLEHIIPKSGKEKNDQKLGEPRLAILPINLVKCCGECNTSKHSKRSFIEEESEINPYFEEFAIEKYFEVNFNDTNEVFQPSIVFHYKDNTMDKRIRNFINNYNIEKTYNHRIKLEFQKILTILANSPLTLTKSILKSYIEHLSDIYSKNSEFEKIDDKYWFDQNYFGFKICEYLVEIIDNDSVIYKLNEEINKRRQPSQYIAFSNQEFQNEMNEVQTMMDLEMFVKNNKEDLIVYYQQTKKQGLSIDFPKLFNKDEDGLSKKSLIEEIVKYYLESGKSFDHFREDCASIIAI
ncbi:HNH endonuclease family protein [Streptococcus mitis]|uniref:HNH endonuclease family protein n=1 Tax=Streptococcus mitis TaxID=28037 RepID=A0A081PV86_STRMT|nr:HNH endonuclease signature motif containing protein [Streptococcus mitis]KEQ34609.1 HNH endonuclease family protein [Streptococcus mitis]